MANTNRWDINRIADDLQKKYDNAIDEHARYIQSLYPNLKSKTALRAYAAKQLREGFEHPIEGKILPDEQFIQMEGALNGIRSIQRKIASSHEKPGYSTTSPAGDGDIRKGSQKTKNQSRGSQSKAERLVKQSIEE